MNNKQLEGKARDLLIDIWRDRHRLSPDCGDDPFTILDPRLAATYLGYEYAEHEELRNFGRENGRTEIAGVIDQQAKRITLSKRFPIATRRFTGGHEVAHAILHPGTVMHRDRPIEGLSRNTSPKAPFEREADHFSACMLVPTRLLEIEFENRFGPIPLRLDDTSAFWLSPDDPMILFEQDKNAFAFSVAGAQSFGGRHFDSLAARFGVSVSTMAYRLKEIDLIDL